MQLHRGSSLLSDQAPEPAQKMKRLAQFLGEPPLPSEVQQVNRQRMIERVRTLWLEHAEPHFLHQQLRRQAEKPEAMDELIQITASLSDQHTSLSLPGSHIATAFKQAHGRLLLLGEQGAGKSTLLVNLLRDLLLRSEQEREFPIPVLLKLASWTSKDVDFSSWLMTELQRFYQVPEKIARNWVNNHEILPLLDGLDEVDAEDVAGCIRAIQSYAEKSRHIQFVVSCCQSVYEAQNKPLPVRGTVHIASLSAHQVEAYCEQVGGPLGQAYQVLQTTVGICELITTPLALCLLTLTANQASFSPALKVDSPNLLRDRLIETYIEQQLTQPNDPVVAQPQEGQRHWLAVLARQLKRVH